MATEYNYDEDGESWPFFLMALLTFILLPLTAKWVYRIRTSDDPKDFNSKLKGSIKGNSETIGIENVDQIKSYQRKQKSAKIFNKTLLVLLVGWSIVIYVGLNFTKQVDLTATFDPYHILGVSSSSSDKEIKSHYRKLSLRFHPDKLSKDLTQVAKEEAEAFYIQITKAYQALTDPVAKAAYLEFGHPDAVTQQVASLGIAIPKFLVEGKYSLIVVAIYFTLIGVLLPFIVGTWWSNVKSHTRKGLHVDTAALFTRKLTDKNPGKVYTPYDLLEWICSSYEVKNTFKHLEPTQVKDLISKHLQRDFTYLKTNPKLEDEKVKLIAILPKLINGLLDIAVIFRHHDIVFAASDLQKAILQGVRPTGKTQELLQLPYVNAKAVDQSGVKRLGKLLTLSTEQQQKVLGITDHVKLQKALDVAAHIPTIRVIESEFVVPGESVVTPSSNAHLSLKFLIKGPKHKSSPKIDEERLKEEETMEYMREPTKSNEEQPQLPFAFTPYFPGNVRNLWNGFLIQQSDNRLVEGSEAYPLLHADLSNLELTQEEWIGGDEKDVVVSSFKLKLSAPTPPTVGIYHFRIVLKNNAYFGCDVDIPLELEVKEPPKIELLDIKKDVDFDDDESDISDPEEDSLASALAALRGDAPVKKTAEELEDESDNESVFTDINTDTEDEGDS